MSAAFYKLTSREEDTLSTRYEVYMGHGPGINKRMYCIFDMRFTHSYCAVGFKWVD